MRAYLAPPIIFAGMALMALAAIMPMPSTLPY